MSFSLVAAKIFQGLGLKRRESSNGDRVYGWLLDRDVPHTQALPRLSKGNGVNIPQPGRGYCMAT